jgi:hypothetical protein
LALRFGKNLSYQGNLLDTLRRVHATDHVQEAWCAVLMQNTLLSLHTDRPSSAEHNVLSAEEATLAQLGARLRLMSDDMGDHPVMIALPSGGAHTRPRLTGDIYR